MLQKLNHQQQQQQLQQHVQQQQLQQQQQQQQQPDLAPQFKQLNDAKEDSNAPMRFYPTLPGNPGNPGNPGYDKINPGCDPNCTWATPMSTLPTAQKVVISTEKEKRLENSGAADTPAGMYIS